MTTNDDFWHNVRKHRKRGKLVGLTTQILSLKSQGASYPEIASFLLSVHGISVSVSALARHIKKASNRSPESPSFPPSLPVSDTAGKGNPPAVAHSPQTGTATLESPPDSPTTRRESSLLARYDRNSDEHLAAVQEFRARKRKPIE